jgi:hypothetical protein
LDPFVRLKSSIGPGTQRSVQAQKSGPKETKVRLIGLHRTVALETALKSSISSFRSIPQFKVRPSQERIALQNARSPSASCEWPSEDFGTRNGKHPKSPLHSHQFNEQLDVISSFALSLVRFDKYGLGIKA